MTVPRPKRPSKTKNSGVAEFLDIFPFPQMIGIILPVISL